MTAPKKAPGKLKIAVDETVQKLNQEVASRGVRATNALRNAELEVLRGKRSGRVYRKPHSKARYTASAPGEPPARRTGMLRMNWNGTVESASSGSGIHVSAVLESQEKYSMYLENGTRHMAARPFQQEIADKAAPEIKRIYSEKYE